MNRNKRRSRRKAALKASVGVKPTSKYRSTVRLVKESQNKAYEKLWNKLRKEAVNETSPSRQV